MYTHKFKRLVYFIMYVRSAYLPFCVPVTVTVHTKGFASATGSKVTL